MKSAIILFDGESMETYSNLVEVCRKNNELSYSTLKPKKFPFVHKNILFVKSKINSSGAMNHCGLYSKLVKQVFNNMPKE